MRAAAALLALSLIALSPAVLPVDPAAAQDEPPMGEGEVRGHVVTSFDEEPIVTDLHLPPGASPTEPAPVVLSGHGWGLDRSSQAGSSTTLALLDAGYAVVTWDARGFGQSGGTVQVDSPEFEGRDVAAIIDWVAQQPEILLEAPADPVLGMVGPSYGGGIQLATATFDRRVDAIVPEITWHDLNRALQPQGVLKLVWQSALFGLGTTTGTVQGFDPRGPAAPQPGTVPPELFQALIQAGTTNEFDEELTAFFAERSLSGYGPNGLLDVPTLLLQGSVDTLFTIDEAVDTYYDLRERDVPTKLVVFCGGLDEAAEDDGAVTHGQCPTHYEPAGDRRRMDDLILRWFDRYLRSLPVDVGPPVEYRTNTGDWHRAEAWPPPSTQRLEVLVSGTAASSGAPGNGFGIGAVPAPPGSPGAVTTTTLGSDTAGRQIEVVGQPQLQVSVGGTGMGAHLYARLIDTTVGELPLGGSAVNNQETPLRLGPLGEAQPISQPMVAAAYTYAPDAPLTVQVDTQSLMYANPRTGPAEVVLDGTITVPYRTLVADRVGGEDRVGTAAELSRDSVTAADVVVIATARDYPDALAGAPLATALGAPLLLTGPDGLADQARREIRRLGATRAVLLGGESVLPAGIDSDLRALGMDVERVAGDDRFATAAAIAARLPASTTAYLVEGINADPARGWPDAVSAAAPAAASGAPVLLTAADRLPQPTLDALSARGATDVVIVGGVAAVSTAVEAQLADAGYSVSRLSGGDRYATSAAVAATDVTRGGEPARVVVAATGRDWPDALAAAGAAAAWDAVLVLVDGQDLDRSRSTLDLVDDRAFDRLVLAGLDGAIDVPAARRLAEAADRGTPPA